MLDLDALEMMLDDVYDPVEQMPKETQQAYLRECRKRLISKVQYYRREVDKHRSQITEMKHSQQKKVECLQSFYQNIALSNNCTARMVRSALSTSKAVVEVLKELQS